MSYRIDPRRALSREIKQIAREELDAAITLLTNPDDMGVERSVHAVRKHTKRLRALIRLVRPGLGRQYSRSNTAIRDASAVLSPLRDTHALAATFDTLLTTHAEHLPSNGLVKVRTALAARSENAAANGAIEVLLGRAATMLVGVRDDVSAWSLPKDVRVAIDGAASFYGQARVAFRRSVDATSEERMHEWRKRVKDGWFHTQLLRDLAPRALEPQQQWLADLSDCLGDNNDLGVLATLLAADPREFGGEQAAQALTLIADVQAELVDRCHRSGARLYAETERGYGRRLHGYLAADRHFGRERNVGGFEAVFTSDS